MHVILIIAYRSNRLDIFYSKFMVCVCVVKKKSMKFCGTNEMDPACLKLINRISLILFAFNNFEFKFHLFYFVPSSNFNSLIGKRFSAHFIVTYELVSCVIQNSKCKKVVIREKQRISHLFTVFALHCQALFSFFFFYFIQFNCLA